MPSPIQSICIVRLSALGDVLMAVPLIRTLQQAFPVAKLTWIISRPAYDLVEGMDNVEFIVIDKPNSPLDYWRFKQRMRGRTFDVLLAVQSSFRANLLYACISAQRRIGYDTLRAKDGHAWFINETIQPGQDHTLDGFLRFAAALDIKHYDIRWDLPASPEDEQWAQTHLPAPRSKPLFLINPAASKPERSWTVDRYIAVINHVKTRWQAEVVLTGGPGAYDRELGSAIANAVEVTNLIGLTKPKQLLATIRKATVLLCPDTGPSHMGVAVGTPVIALHAVTSPDVSGPYLYRHLSIDRYPDAVTTVLKKTPETNTWGTHAHGSDTMSLITVNDVIAKIDAFFLTVS
ncbi:MAG: glycosyltransferase family 9 protein [Gammaproteobacteria bacterium]|nr:glycosyltransferase family 9 protein [Gammaproteobacteria bacterium]